MSTAHTSRETDDHLRQLANEQAADSDYRDAIDAKEARRGVSIAHRNTWTGANSSSSAALPAGGLVGRVALLEYSDTIEGSDFYIGARYLETDDLTVYSWAAPVACAFFRGKREHPLFDQVALTRSLLRSGGRVVDYVDDAVAEEVPQEPFSSRRLRVPTGPSNRRPPRRDRPKKTPADDSKDRRTSPAPSEPDRARQASTQERIPPPGDRAAPGGAAPPLRAEQALRAAIAAPRRPRLSSVLSTLQPDQHDYVTRSPHIPLVLQGHPGTGKTIVAAHRAAYLVHPDSPDDRRLRRVLIVGPTDYYVTHIRGVLADLAAERSGVRAVSLPGLLADMRESSQPQDQSHAERFEDVDWRLGSFADDVARRLRAAGTLSTKLRLSRAVEAIYEALRANSAAGVPVTQDPEWIEYLAGLPPARRAVTMHRFDPLLAQCAWSAQPRSKLAVDHVIVDEAQDVSPLEWRLLAALNPRDSWTLLGDMNQRRSDWTYHSWNRLGVDLGIADLNGVLAVEAAGRGYRTTSAIMKFANKLLPSSERGVDSLQTDGEDPVVVRVKRADLYPRSVSESLRLVDEHRGGSVAIIGVDSKPAVRELRRRGFVIDSAEPRRLVQGERAVWVLDANQARGLEFDAAVVVEPGEFPKNLGRHGLLYTSLTRANRKLAVVHTLPLPDALRRHGRR